MSYFPIFLDLTHRPVLVVGGGDIAARKVSLLLKAGAEVHLIAPGLNQRLQSEHQAGRLIYQPRKFEASDVEGKVLVIAATNNRKVNEQASQLAQAANIPVNVVDQPELCSYIMPSIVDRAPVQIAISTGGASPVLARLLRARLETLIPAAYGKLATLVQGFRQQVKQRFTTTDERKRFWEGILQGPIAEMLFAGQDKAAADALAAAIDHPDTQYTGGEVYLVGAGPGDPDLLTFRALRLMQQADVVLYDRLVSDEIMELCRRDAERIYVGKERSDHIVPQPHINELLVELAQQGKRVLRLKGGDPFIFGRGGEELDRLVETNIPFQVVPGITAATGCASYAGIPLTHRDYSQSCLFVTGHLSDGTMNLNWSLLTQANQTVVIYMGLTGFALLCQQLIEHGLPATTPVALIEHGTMRDQRVFTGTLSDLPTRIEQSEVHAPTLVIVGEVVKLHDKLNWFHPNQ